MTPDKYQDHYQAVEEEDKDELLGICERQIERYYETRVK